MAKQTPLDRAIQKAGGQSELARICSVSQPSVWGWVNKRDGVVPAEHAAAIEEATGVPRYQLRPDLWAKPEKAA